MQSHNVISIKYPFIKRDLDLFTQIAKKSLGLLKKKNSQMIESGFTDFSKARNVLLKMFSN